MRDLRIVVPACNEADRIGPTLRDYCREFRDTATIVVVANGCTDATGAVVRGVQRDFDNLELVEIPARIGKGGAVRVGLFTGNESFTGFVDADGSTPAPEFARLYDTLRGQNYDAVIGSRWLPGARVEPPQPFARRVASRGFNTIVRALFGLTLSDTQCGAKLFRRSAVREVLRSLEVADFAFDIEVLWRLSRAGYRICELPTVWADRCAGTKIRLVRSSWAMLRSVVRLRLKETALWRLPLVDRFGRVDVIPVRVRPRILLLGAALHDAAGDRELGRFVARLQESGFELVDAGTERAGAGRVAFFLWYAFASRRDYDAIVEVASAAPSWIPAFSSKPTFLLATCDARRRFPARAHRSFARSARCDLAGIEPARAADAVAESTLGRGLYAALFIADRERLSFRYVNAESGALEHHVLG